MLTVKVEENGENALKELGATAPRGAYVMVMREGESLMGAGVMRLFEGYASVDGIYMKTEYDSFDLRFGMAKSMLNFIDLRGIGYAVCSFAGEERLLTALRFKPISEVDGADFAEGNWKYCLNLKGYFTSNC